jgi:uncharacterized protein YjdB
MRATSCAVTVLGLLAAGCTTHPKVTYLDVQVLFDSHLMVDQLIFDVADASGAALLAPTTRPATPGMPLGSGGHVDIILSDAVAGHMVTTHVKGSLHGKTVITGQATATLLAAQGVPATVFLGKRTALTSLAITPMDTLAVGAIQQLHAIGTFEDGTTLDLTTSASWSSSSTSTLSFDKITPGRATAHTAGNVTVTAIVAGVTGTAMLAVSSAELQSLSITPVTPQIPVGLTRAFVATGAFADGSARDLTEQVTWSVTDANIAIFDGTTRGLLHARQAGMVTVGARLGSISANDMVTISSATLSSIVISPTNPTLARGALKQLYATGLFSDGTSADLTSSVTWSSSDSSIADIGTSDGSSGQVDALNKGMVTITARSNTMSGSVSGTTDVTVTAATLKSLAITPPTTMLAKGTSAQLTVTGVFSDTTTMDLTASAMWSSDMPNVVSVGNDAANKGRVTGTGTGMARIHATFGGLGADAQVTGSAAVLTLLSVTPTAPTLPKGGQLQLRATGTFSDQTVQDLTAQVTWSAGDGTVLQVSNVQGMRGLAFAVAPGSVLATATFGNMSGATNVSVTPATLQTLTITPANVNIADGTAVQLHASGIFSDQTMQDLTAQVTWTSSALDVAVVSNAPGTQGLVTSLMPGPTVITVMLGTTTVSANLTVSAAQLASIGVQPTNPSVPSGVQQQFRAIGVYSDHTTQDLTTAVTWGSSDPLTASISNADPSRGLATATAPVGNATITAVLGPISGSTTLTATPAVLSSLEVTPINASAPVGTMVQLQATGIYSDQTRRDLTTAVTWSSSDVTIVAISNVPGSQGLATALQTGATSIVSASLAGVSGSTTLQVTAAVLQQLAVQPTNPSIALGTTQQLTATGTFSDGSHRDLTTQVTWSSSQPNIAAISNTDGSRGLATSLSVGSTTIVSAVMGGQSASTSLTVSPATLRSLAVTPVQGSIPLGTTEQLVAIGTFTDNSTQDLTATATWTSSDETIATVSSASDTAGLVASVATGGPITVTAQVGSIGGSAKVTVTPAGLRSIAVTPTGVSIALGTTQQLTATGIYTDNSRLDLTAQVTWSSNVPSVALVSNGSDAGLVTSVAVGPASISASFGGQSGSTTVTVTAATLKSIAISPATPMLPLGTSLQLTATGLYTDGSKQDLTATATWGSSNASIATLSNAGGTEGLATSVAEGGPITVTATVGQTLGTTTLTVTAAMLKSINVSPALPNLPLGTTLQLIATGTYTDGTTPDLTSQVTWSSSSDSTASVSNSTGSAGVVTPLMRGPATISATLGSVSGATTVAVTDPTLVGLTISPSAPSVALGFTQQLSVTASYSDSSVVDATALATWSSSDNRIATISNAANSAGLATPLAANATVTISADYGGKTTATTLTITPATLRTITISPPSPSVAKGLTLALGATGHFSDGSAADLTTTVAWSAVDATIVAVSSAPGSAGQATGLAQGSTMVTAQSGGVTGSATFSVTMATLSSITISPSSIAIANGTDVQLTATGHFSDTSTEDLTSQVAWQVMDETIATVSIATGSEGLLTSVMPGSTSVSAMLGGRQATASLQVKNVTLMSIAVTPPSSTISVGGTRQLTATGTFSDNSTQDLTTQASWSSADSTEVVVSNSDGMRGLCSGVSAGDAVSVSATLLGVSGAASVSVTP